VELAEAAASGDRRKTLEALRDFLATELTSGVAAVGLASTAKLLVDVVRELDSMPGAHPESVSDDLAKRRQQRKAAARKPEAASK
jgi:hypothetical protein